MSSIVLLGNISIGLAIGLCLFGMILFYTARSMESVSSTAAALGRGAVYGNFILMTVANLAMVYALMTNDFSVSYVAHVGAIETPRWISAISLWSSLEGSILFWGWILAAYSAVCIYFYRNQNDRTLLWVGLILLGVQVFFYLLLALPANPFLSMDPVPPNGPGPNPLLQNHWLMAIHPPCLYMGYIGFTVPFAFAIAALIESDLTGDWVRRTRRWTLFAWSFLSMAIVLGGWWSYAVLGWGGYWAWDPVENASFMPWLAATALVHSVMVQEKRKMLPIWNLILAVLTFLLTLLGTFLTRSGVLDSVHSFTESHVGPYFLVFIGMVLAVSLALLLGKGPAFREQSEGAHFENIFSLEVLFLFNNLLFLSFCLVVFVGTLYPLAIEAIKGSRISVGEPYFNQMTVPITGMILLLMGIGLVTPWKKGNPKIFFATTKIPALLAGVTTIVSVMVGARAPAVAMMILLAAFAFFIMLIEFLKVSRKRGMFQIFSDNPRRYGGFVAHTGALIIIVAVAISASYGHDKEITLKKGESAQLENFSLRLEGIGAEETPQRYEIKADIDVSRNGNSVGHLFPQMNFYSSSREPLGSPSVRSTLIGDLYLTLIHFEEDGSSVSLRAIYTPAVAWIWIGGVIVMAGGLISLSLGRREV